MENSKVVTTLKCCEDYGGKYPLFSSKFASFN
jgi:hypothetical protein